MRFFLKSLMLFLSIAFASYACVWLGFFSVLEEAHVLVLGICAYLLGTIPFGLILTKVCARQDLREVGSGNIGATNVLRTGKKGLAAATLFLDALKVASVVLLVKHLYPDISFALWVASLGVLGHLFPIWLDFRGGKGVASGAGAVLALTPFVGGIALLVWVITFAMTRISSLSAVVALMAAPLSSWFLEQPRVLTFWLLGLSLLILYKHKENIVRLIQGREGKIDLKSPKDM